MQGTNYKISKIQRNNKHTQCAALPLIPEKRYFIISEVGYLCGVKPYVLRFWEQEFPQIKPVKRRGNRRYYQYNDVMIIREIRRLLYEDGYTIEGARAQLVSKSIKKNSNEENVIKNIIVDLEAMLQKLKMEEELSKI